MIIVSCGTNSSASFKTSTYHAYPRKWKNKLSDVPLQASKLHICTLHLACKFLEMLPKVHLYPCLSLCINETKKTGTAWVLKFGKGGTLILSSLWVC